MNSSSCQVRRAIRASRPMADPKLGKMRWLYLLALVQLVGGPLVLMQVTVFCKLAFREAPRVGMAHAASAAWRSQEMQTALTAADIAKTDGDKTDSDKGGKKQKLEKAKQPVIPWKTSSPLEAAESSLCKIAGRTRTWTPDWPHPPPGPPPRMV